MEHFPVFLNLKDRDIIIFGGGEFALQRINKLKPFGARIKVISENICDEIGRIEGIEVCTRSFCVKDLDINPVFVVIAESEEITKNIYYHCKTRHIPVNAVDMPKYCDIIFPAVIATDNLCIGISSGGYSPTATVEFKERIEQLIPENIDEIIKWMLPVRDYVNTNVLPDKRKTALRNILREAIMRNKPLDEENINNILKKT